LNKLPLIIFILVVTLASGCSLHDKPILSDSQRSLPMNPVKILMSEPRESNPEDLLQVKQYIEDRSGVKMEVRNIRTEADFDKQLNISLANGEDIDVILLKNYDNYLMLNEKNALMDIKPILEKYGQNILSLYPEEIWKAVTDKSGRILGIPKLADYGSEIIVVRKDWRIGLGMKPITTIEELEQFMIAVRDLDLDGNGKQDSIPLLSYSPQNDYTHLDHTLLHLFTETNTNGNYLNEQGRITPTIMHPKYKDYIATLARWHQEGLLFPDIYSAKKSQVDDLIIHNKVGAFASWYTDYIRPLEKLRQTVPEADYEYVHLETLSGKPGKFRHDNKFSQRAVFLVTSKNVEQAIRLFDWMLASKENYWSTKWGIYGEYWEWEDEHYEIVKRLKGLDNPKNSYNKTYSMMYYSPWDFREKNPVFVDARYYAGKDYFNARKDLFVSEPDWFIYYNFSGTPIYSIQQEAQTYIIENKIQLIIGKKSVDEWDEIIEQYAQMYGNDYIEIATRQFQENG
jgi:hypothetical protein